MSLNSRLATLLPSVAPDGLDSWPKQNGASQRELRVPIPKTIERMIPYRLERFVIAD
jgi:hypothetical protein